MHVIAIFSEAFVTVDGGHSYPVREYDQAVSFDAVDGDSLGSMDSGLQAPPLLFSHQSTGFDIDEEYSEDDGDLVRQPVENTDSVCTRRGAK